MIAWITLLLGISSGNLSLAASLEGADHHGVVRGETIEWTTTLVFDAALEGGTNLPLAFPLPEGSTVEGPAWTRLDGEGQVVALLAQPSGAPPRFTLKTRQRIGEGPVTLRPPLVQDDDLQRIRLEGLRYEPDPALGLRRTLTSWAPPSVTSGDRRQAERLLDGFLPKPRLGAVWIRTDGALADAGGLRGSLGPSGGQRGVVFGVLVALAVGLGTLAVGTFRALGRQAQAEKVEAWLKEDHDVSAELALLDRGTRPPREAPSRASPG